MMVLFALAIVLGLAGVGVLLKGLKGGKYRWAGLVGIGLGVLVLLSSMFIVIDAGEVGVMVVFGSVQPGTLGSGINLVPPYAEIFKYSTREQVITLDGGSVIEARDKAGLILRIDCTTSYLIDAAQVARIYKDLATNMGLLEEKFLLPAIRTVFRDVISGYTAEEVYSSKRVEVAQQVRDTLLAAVADKGMLIKDFQVRAINLPEEIDKAIQAKITAEQESLAMTFKKQKAQQEGEIKMIEARALAESQKIINATLTPAYLQHEAIQAYDRLAASPNTTFVVMPTSATGTGLPLILGGAK